MMTASSSCAATKPRRSSNPSSRRAQFRVHLIGVIAALARNDCVALFQVVDACRIFEFRLVFRERRRIAAALLVLKKHRFDQVKSPSCCMRCIRTLPTMPRQPTRPTFMTYNLFCGTLPRLADPPPA